MFLSREPKRSKYNLHPRTTGFVCGSRCTDVGQVSEFYKAFHQTVSATPLFFVYMKFSLVIMCQRFVLFCLYLQSNPMSRILQKQATCSFLKINSQKTCEGWRDRFGVSNGVFLLEVKEIFAVVK